MRSSEIALKQTVSNEQTSSLNKINALPIIYQFIRNKSNLCTRCVYFCIHFTENNIHPERKKSKYTRYALI